MSNNYFILLLYCFLFTLLAKIYCNLATVWAKNTNRIEKLEQAKKLLYKALNTIDNNSEIIQLVELCIYLNLSGILNQLGNYNESIIYIERAYEKINRSK